jgi:hypothetical protein
MAGAAAGVPPGIRTATGLGAATEPVDRITTNAGDKASPLGPSG